MQVQGFIDRLTGRNKEAWKEGRIRGTAVLVKKDVLGLGDFHASLLDGVHNILGHKEGVAFRLVSATARDPSKHRRRRRRSPAKAKRSSCVRFVSCFFFFGVCVFPLQSFCLGVIGWLVDSFPEQEKQPRFLWLGFPFNCSR